jgi:hypothetical protein
MYEHRTHPILSRVDFAKRVVRHMLLAFIVLALALGFGVVGYHTLGELDWLDALLNASMILVGMGTVDPLHKTVAKLFASGYALFSGLVFISVASLLIGPFAHRLLHRFHLDER